MPLPRGQHAMTAEDRPASIEAQGGTCQQIIIDEVGPTVERAAHSVIASVAKQSKTPPRGQPGSLRYARNDDVEAVTPAISAPSAPASGRGRDRPGLRRAAP